MVRSLRKWGIMEKKLEGPAGKKKHEKVVEQKKERDKETDNAGEGRDNSSFVRKGPFLFKYIHFVLVKET